MCWALIYQADVRFRREHTTIMQRDLNHDLNVALEANGKHPFNPQMPWDYIYGVADNQDRFWKKEAENPAIKIMVNPSALSQFIESDARIAGSSSQHVPSQHAERGLPSGGGDKEPGNKRKQNNKKVTQPKAAPKKKQRTTRGGGNSAKIENGCYVTNKTGAKLCRDFQNGKCSGSGPCKNNPAFKHQCSKCLDNRHGAFQPKACKAVPKSS